MPDPAQRIQHMLMVSIDTLLGNDNYPLTPNFASAMFRLIEGLLNRSSYLNDFTSGQHAERG